MALVRLERLELSRVAPQRPQRCASTNSAITAANRILQESFFFSTDL